MSTVHKFRKLPSTSSFNWTKKKPSYHCDDKNFSIKQNRFSKLFRRTAHELTIKIKLITVDCAGQQIRHREKFNLF